MKVLILMIKIIVIIIIITITTLPVSSSSSSDQIWNKIFTNTNTTYVNHIERKRMLSKQRGG